MTNENKSQPKCGICGRFIANKEFEQEKIMVEFTPDTEHTVERTEYLHYDCWKVMAHKYSDYELKCSVLKSLPSR